MKLNNLLKRIDNFYKLAGTLEYPVKMHQEILEWASSIYCAHILENLQEIISDIDVNSEEFKRASVISGMLKSHIKGDLNDIKIFKINLDDVSFLEKEVSYVKSFAPHILNKHITVFFNATEDVVKREGGYDPKNQTITIQKQIEPAISENKIQAALKDLSSIIRHELQHVVQFYARRLKGVSSYKDVGMPSKNISPDQDDKDELKINHYLRNSEFYTQISDSYDNLKEMFRLLPKSTHRFIFDTCIGTIPYGDFYRQIFKDLKMIDPYFKKAEFEKNYRRYLDVLNSNNKGYSLMRSRQPEKYVKLVKELYKLVGDDL